MSAEAVATKADWKPDINPWIIAMTVMLATFMEVLDTSIANVALPHIAGSLSSSVDESTWVLTSYLVSNAIVLPLTGWFSTLFGRKRFYMACVAIFTVSSFLCGLAPSLGALVVLRVIQGAGGGGLQPVSQAILVESFEQKQQGMAMAVYGMGVVVAPIIGPTLGGWITDNYSWRWIFFINIPVGILALLLTSMLIKDPPYLVRKGLKDGLKIDFIGLGLLSVGLGFLQIMLDKGQTDDWFGSHFIVISAILAVIGLVGVVIWELRQKEPIIDLRLLKDKNFAVSTFTMFALGVVLYGTTVLLPILVQTLMGYTAELSGLVLSPGAVITMFSMPLVGWLLSRYEARWLVVVGLLILALGMYELAHINLTVSFWTLVLIWCISRGGLGFLFVPINVMAFYFVPREKTNNATGLINVARNIGGSVGISLVTTLQVRRAEMHQNILVSHVTPYDNTYQSM
ncbi:MAG TPA: DHA2 family efflux MFS transporter permease subunit, partial [Terriglobia bacterium]|nr:DHA2 family efflux MFS transporter permease subunit [Terriglobia bacterium]